SHPAGVSISRSVNNTGTIASETNGRGKTTSYSYNGMNQLTGISPPSGSNISISWSSTGRTLTRGGYSQAITFDGFGRPSLITTEGIAQNINYNALGHKSFQSYLDSSSGDSYGTDVLGRVESVSHGDGSNRSYSYNSNNRVSLRNERGNSFTYHYRSFGDPDRQDERMLMQVTAPEGMTTSFNRDILGNVTGISQGSVTRGYGYNSSNFVTSESNPETGTTVYGRDAVGNMTSRRVGSSSTTTYTYDGLNRLTDINYPGSTPDVALTYDDNSNLTLVDNGVARRSLSYDNNDNLTTETLTVGGKTFTADYGYDSLDYLASIRYPSGRSVSYAPDDLGRPTAASPYLTSASHHPNGIPRRLDYANGQITTTTLNNRQWIAGLATQRSGADAVDLTYDYDGLANVVSILNRLDSRDSKAMSYDGVDRLTRAGDVTVGYDAQDNLTAMSTRLGNLSYNYAGNRLSSVSGYKSLSLSYDDYGNVTRLGPYTFTYDDAATLRSVTGAATANYDYDGRNLRVRAARAGLETLYVYTLDGRLLGEYDSAGLWKKEYAYLGTQLVAETENPDTDGDGIPDSTDNCRQAANADQRNTDGDTYGNRCDADLNNDGLVNFADLGILKLRFGGTDPDADFNGDGFVNFADLGILKQQFGLPPGPGPLPPPTRYTHPDALGSPVAATDAQGQLLWRERYEPYGDRIDKPTAAQTNTRWHTGHVQDPETGLVYAKARYYDPTLGRFLSIDPTGPSPDSLHSINRYAYGNNNPYRYVDPDGQVPVDTVVDAGYVIYDFGRLLGAGAAYTVGTVTGNEFLRAEGAAGLRDTGIDLGGSATGLVVPYAPAAVTRGIGRGVGDVAKGAGKARNEPPAPLKEAEGRPHSIIEKPGKEGQYTTHYGDGTWKQYRGSGQDHGGIPRPNVKEAGKNVTPDGRMFIDRGRVRPARPDEIPGG
ncbi:MAG TPA: RHS repeat-associated core domain-containing protein, partial [Acidiferrobacterales bacterium]